MFKLLWMIPALPLLSSLILILTQGRLQRSTVALLGVGSVGLAALIALAQAAVFLQQPEGTAYTQLLWHWIALGSFQPDFSLYLDGLSLVMMLVVTCVGFLIHLYASGYMYPDPSYSRFFAYMNLFLASMLILVLADNLVFLYVGWEGVGLCSYLLIGFWYQDPENGQAARKAFVVTRVGDTAMVIGLFLIFRELHTLNIQEVMAQAPRYWGENSTPVILVTLLLLGGAVGKSAQLPLQSWLPDAMAGPTPVSALIHAATMVTAGVYLIARTHELFLLAPSVQFLVAVIGALTLLLAGFSALTQTDIKRILAYSTISQIGYMFLALGVGAWSFAIFHLVTHAFFKALLFLSAGSVILNVHHEQNIFRMGGLKNYLPLPFFGFLVGSACLAALPFTSGFYSKDPILAYAWASEAGSPWLWLAGALGAFLTALYSFRLIFVVFFGRPNCTPTPFQVPRSVRIRMQIALLTLISLALTGGMLDLPLEAVLPSSDLHASLGIEVFNTLVPLAGLLLAFKLYYQHPEQADRIMAVQGTDRIRQFWLNGCGFDGLYDRLFRFPFLWLTHINRNDIADRICTGTETSSRFLHQVLSATQTGQIRWYAAVMGLGLAVLLGAGVLV
jgi:NADH-quinone oxidoreductase subunit L